MATFRWKIDGEMPFRDDPHEVGSVIAHIVSQCDVDVEIMLEVTENGDFHSTFNPEVQAVRELRRRNHLCYVIIELIRSATGAVEEKPYLM